MQAITVSIERPENYDSLQWDLAQQELGALVRRMGFTIWAKAFGMPTSTYHIMGERSEPLGPPDGSIDPFDAVRRELADLKYVYGLDSARVTFGAVDTV